MLHIHDLEPGDTATVRAVFEGLSAASRSLRFLTGLPDLSTRMLRLLADVDPVSHVVHVAMVDGAPVGLVRWIRDPAAPEQAELALEVADEAQGHGVGAALGAAAARSAAAGGVTTFWAYFGDGNRGLRVRVLALGGVVAGSDASEVRFPVAGLRT